VKKICVIIILNLLLSNTSFAGQEGYGEIKLSPAVVKYFNEYLGNKSHGSKGALKHGRGDYFFVSESGEGFGYSYCPQSYSNCVTETTLARRQCLKDVKKYLKRKEKCKLFAKGRYIVWNANKYKIPNKASISEVNEILRDQGYIN
jgi:hypothetical protein